MKPQRLNPLATVQPVTLSEPPQLPAAALNYDYSLIQPQHRSQVQTAAGQIKLDFKRAQNSLLNIGKQLHGVKDCLQHGQFGEWLQIEFQMDERTAQRYMAAWREFGTNPDAHLLSSSAMMMLSGPSTPDTARVEIIETAKSTGVSPTKAQVTETINRHRSPKPQPVATGRAVAYSPKPVPMFDDATMDRTATSGEADGVTTTSAGAAPPPPTARPSSVTRPGAAVPATSQLTPPNVAVVASPARDGGNARDGGSTRSIYNLIAYYKQSLELLSQVSIQTQEFAVVGKAREAIEQLVKVLEEAS